MESTSPVKKNGNLSSYWQQLQSWCQWSVSQNKFETFQQCQQCIKSTHNASILSSIIAVNIRSFQSFYFQLTGIFI